MLHARGYLITDDDLNIKFEKFLESKLRSGDEQTNAYKRLGRVYSMKAVDMNDIDANPEGGINPNNIVVLWYLDEERDTN